MDGMSKRVWRHLWTASQSSHQLQRELGHGPVNLKLEIHKWT